MYARTALIALLLLSAGCARLEESSGFGGDDPHSAAAGGPRPAIAGVAGGSDAASIPTARTAFANAPDRGDLVAYPAKPVVRHDGAYTWHRADLSEEHALRAIATGHMAITSPSGERLQFRYERHVEHPSGDLTWVGRLEGGERSDEVVVTFGEKGVFGTIGQSGKPPLRLTMADGVSWLVQTDPSQIAGIDNAATRPGKPDYLLPPPKTVSAAGLGASADQPVNGASSLSTAAASATATTTVDVLLGYTAGFASATNGAPLTRLNNMVEVSNQAYANSGLSGRVRLVHAMQVNYPDNTDNGVALEELTGFKAPSTRTTPAAAFSALRAAREQYGADLVSLVRKFSEPENKGCGIAWLIGGEQSGIHASDEYFGYSVVSDGRDAGTDGKTYFCREETLAHELGHNMGSQHDVATAKGDDGVLQAREYGVYPYSFGHKTTASGGNFYTVMAYGDSGQTSYRIFSNPLSTFCGGQACGTADHADNTRSLAQTMPIVGAFRATIVGPSAKSTHNDIDGDGDSDVLLFRSGSFVYWIMEGRVLVRSKAFAVNPDWRVAATGDFDGNGRVDIVWMDGAHALHVWLGNGTTFAANPAFTLASSYQVLGAGDVDLDGSDDLIVQRGGQLVELVMNGAEVVRSKSYAVDPSLYAQAIGDFDGNGRADIVLSDKSGNVKFWLGGSTGYTSRSVIQINASYRIVAAQDIDGDAKSDLLLFRPGSVAQLFFDGAVPLRSRAYAISTSYVVASAGDFDTNGRSDFLLQHVYNRSLYQWLSTGTGYVSRSVSAVPASGYTPIR